MAERPIDDAAKQVVKKISDQLLCSLCLEEYCSPRVLPCMHVFCEACLEKMLKSQKIKQSVSCPHCRRVVTLPQEGVSSLPSAFHIQKLFEVREDMKKVRNPNQTQCDKCAKGEVKGFCRACDQCLFQKAELASSILTAAELKTRSIRLDERGFKAKAKADSEIDKLKAMLDVCRRDLHSEIDGKVHHRKKELEDQIDRHELRQAQLSSCVEFVDSGSHSGTQQELLSVRSRVEQRAQQMTNNFNPRQLPLGDDQAFRLVCTQLSPARQTLKQLRFEWVPFEGTHVRAIDGIKSPRHIAFATTGEMVVCGWNTNRMTVFDSSDKCLRTFGNTGSEESKLVRPKGVAISSDNTVFVAANQCVKKFTLDGQFIASVGSEGGGRLEFRTPCAIAYNHANDCLYVCDTHNHRITILKHDLTFFSSFGSKGSALGQLNRPEGISVDSEGSIFVAEYGNKRIQVFDASGHSRSSITQTTPGQHLQGPHSVSVGPDDCVYVLEHDANRVSVFEDSGKYIKSFGTKGNKDGEFSKPYAVAVSDDGYVYVSDTDNRRVQVFK